MRRVVLGHRCHIHVIPHVLTSSVCQRHRDSCVGIGHLPALLRVGIRVPGIVVLWCQRTPRTHRVVLVRRHPDRRDGTCGHRDQLDLDGRRNVGC